LKKGFPGDPEFSRDNYWLLPYDYVISATSNLSKLRGRELHEYERPIAVLAVQQAEMNRDRKKRKKPFELDEFCLYNFENKKDTINPIYGAAALELIKIKEFPIWALFIYKELSERAAESAPPDVLCYKCDQAIILAPTIEENICRGMLIATELAGSRILTMQSPCGKELRVRMPPAKAKVIAEENCYLDIVG
jgi:hypothetical protein